MDIVHGSNDMRVPYDSEYANYRVYHDIEHCSCEQIPISKCDEFERTHTIINTKRAFYDRTYYAI